MGKNTGDGKRNGQIKERSQVYNEYNGMYVKRDTKTGKFISQKDSPYKGIRKEK